MMNFNFLNLNYNLIACPRCEGQGWLFPWKIKINHSEILVCEECNATWPSEINVSRDNFNDLSTYITQFYSHDYFGKGRNVYDEMEELQHETILENVSQFGGYSFQHTTYNIYYSNVFFISECRINEQEFFGFIKEYYRQNCVEPISNNATTRIIRYNFRWYTDLQSIESKHVDLFTHTARSGFFYFSLSQNGNVIQHVVYDKEEEKMYSYKIAGKKGNKFFNEAITFHNVFYSGELVQ